MDEKPKNLAELPADNSQSVSLVTVILVIAILGLLVSIILRSMPDNGSDTNDIRGQSVDGGSAPVISRILLREEWQNNTLVVYQDIYFTDADGDASRVDFTLVETTATEVHVEDGIVTERPEAQREGTAHTGTWTCHSGTHTVTLQVALIDQNDNRSADHMFTITCRN